MILIGTLLKYNVRKRLMLSGYLKQKSNNTMKDPGERSESPESRLRVTPEIRGKMQIVEWKSNNNQSNNINRGRGENKNHQINNIYKIYGRIVKSTAHWDMVR